MDVNGLVFSTQETFGRVRLQIEFLWSRKMINCLFGQVLASFESTASKSGTKQLKSGEDGGGLPAEFMQSKYKIFGKFNSLCGFRVFKEIVTPRS
jgi:hypothetical protein